MPKIRSRVLPTSSSIECYKFQALTDVQEQYISETFIMPRLQYTIPANNNAIISDISE